MARVLQQQLFIMAEILIVDDSDDISLPLSLLMELEGHRVRVARNGLEGLAALIWPWDGL